MISISRLISLLVVCVFISCIMLIPCSAATFNPQFPDYKVSSTADSSYWANNVGMTLIDDLKNDISYSISGTYHWDRDIDGTVYSFDSRTFRPSMDDIQVKYMSFELPTLSLFKDYPATYFNDLDLYVGVNWYCDSAVDSVSYYPMPTATIGGLLPSDYDPSSLAVPGLTFTNSYRVLKVALHAASFNSSQKSLMCIYHISYHAEERSEYFIPSGQGLESDIQIRFDYPITNTDINDIDCGLVGGVMGADRQYVFFPWVDPNLPSTDDIWSGLPDLAPVPSVGAGASGTYNASIYNRVRNLDIVKSVITPIGTMAISFFCFRVVFWKNT